LQEGAVEGGRAGAKPIGKVDGPDSFFPPTQTAKFGLRNRVKKREQFPRRGNPVFYLSPATLLGPLGRFRRFAGFGPAEGNNVTANPFWRGTFLVRFLRPREKPSPTIKGNQWRGDGASVQFGEWQGQYPDNWKKLPISIGAGWVDERKGRSAWGCQDFFRQRRPAFLCHPAAQFSEKAHGPEPLIVRNRLFSLPRVAVDGFPVMRE